MKRIAAGEVVERPASVLKELLENALDARSTSVTIRIRDAGSSLIEVTDDGEGMLEEDALLCCRRHATSKIQTEDDLETIQTMGFRGEALASICSVSRMEIATCGRGESEGTKIYLEDGEIRDVLKIASRKGTTLSVKNLFANVPARRKFLKSTSTELQHILRVFKRISLAHPSVQFTLWIDDEKTMELRSSDLKGRVEDILGEFVNQSIHLDKTVSNVHVHGWISKPGEGRRTRENQFLFLNGRYIQNRSISFAVMSAYGPRLGRDEYPVSILFLEMDARAFDVNVHPTKNEVRFTDERLIHDLVKRAVQDVLRAPDVVPQLHLVTRANRTRTGTFSGFSNGNQLSLEVQSPDILTARSSKTMANQPILWQIHNRYILSQIKSGLTIIDQHVAHERVLYEKTLACREKSGLLSQQLLFPQTIQLSPDDFLLLMEILPILQRMGFGLKEFGKNTVVIEAVPVELRKGNDREILLGILDHYRNSSLDTQDPWDRVAKAFACKSAIKSGDPLTPEEMVSLIDQLFATKEPYFCPHGRPVLVNLTLEEIDKRFGR